jgi:uncharacterized membrane protein (UPF0127 family)
MIGLMYRDEIGKGSGMLFIFGSPGNHGIWMKNMRFPIDIAWLDSRKIVVSVVHSAMPCRSINCPVYKPGSTAKYVIELSSGVLAKHGIKIGDRLSFDD